MFLHGVIYHSQFQGLARAQRKFYITWLRWELVSHRPGSTTFFCPLSRTSTDRQRTDHTTNLNWTIKNIKLRMAQLREWRRSVATDHEEDSASIHSSNVSGDEEADGGVEIAERPSKRRRLSDSEQSENKSFVPQKPLPALSRIKKKSDPKDTKDQSLDNGEPDPVTAKDAFALGLQSTDSSFASLGLAPWLVGALSAMAIKRPTAIQRACIPEILKGRDCIGGSRTGSGKTAAFAAPILHQWSEDPFGVFAVVLTPTR